jgi:hypothetical protein
MAVGSANDTASMGENHREQKPPMHLRVDRETDITGTLSAKNENEATMRASILGTAYRVRPMIGSATLAASFAGAESLFGSRLSIVENSSLVRIGFET